MLMRWTSSLIVLWLALVATDVSPVGSNRAEALLANDEPAGRPSSGSAALPTIFPTHPRLIIGGYRGVSVADLRAACQAPEMQGQCDRIGGEHMLGDAMKYLLTGDKAAAAKAEAALRQPLDCSDTVEVASLGGYALAFDWIHDTIADPRAINTLIGNCGLQIATDSLRSNGPHLWHGYTAIASSVALAALAVDPGFAGRDNLLGQATELFRGTALEAYQVVGGAWPEGYNYERSHFFSGDPPDQYVIDALRAWDSAVEQDHPKHASLFETIATEEGDWLRGLGYHILYGTLDAYGPGGKKTLMRGGDLPTGQAYPNKQYRPFVDSIARAYHDGTLAWWGRSLEKDWSFVGGDGTYHSIHRYSLPYNLPIGVASVDPRAAELPLGRIWGRADLGYLITRSGWSVSPVTGGRLVIGYRAGKWFTGHQHMDQGHIDIWQDGPLAVDSGVYANWGSEHRESYYMRSIAHNTLIIPSAGEKFDQYPGMNTPVNDGGQRLQTNNKLGCAQCVQSVAEWRQNLGKGLHYEAGAIEAFEEDPRYTVVASDLTSAYNSTRYSTPGNRAKVEVVQRDLTYLRPESLVVADRVRTTEAGEAPRFVLHMPTRPLFDTNAIRLTEGTAADGILAGSGGYFQVRNVTGGGLDAWTLLPAQTRMTVIGGPNHRYWVDGANRVGGSAGMEGAPAEPGAWRIEVSPEGASRDTVMVHGLVMANHTDAPSFRLDRVELDPLAGPVVAVESYITSFDMSVVLVMSGAVPRQPVLFARIELPALPFQNHADLLLRDLRPNAHYVASLEGRPFTTPDIRSSVEGVLRLRAPGSGWVTLAVCPAPDGAGPAWREACAAEGQPTGTPPAPTATPEPTPPADILVTGLVYDSTAGTSRPIQGARVYVGVVQPRQPFQALTGADGRYQFIVPAAYAPSVNRIGANATGYVAQESSITADALARQPVRDFALVPETAPTPMLTPTPTPRPVYLPLGLVRERMGGVR